MRFEYFSVSAQLPSKVLPDVPAEAERVSQKLYQTAYGRVGPQLFQPLPEKDEDWCILFDPGREKAVLIPPGIKLNCVRSLFVVHDRHASVTQHLSHFICAPVEIIQDVKKKFEHEVTTTETRTHKEMIIDVSGRQDVARFSGIRLSQIETPFSSEGEDDWFVLLDFAREKPAVTPAGTFPSPKALCTLRYLL